MWKSNHYRIVTSFLWICQQRSKCPTAASKVRLPYWLKIQKNKIAMSSQTGSERLLSKVILLQNVMLHAVPRYKDKFLVLYLPILSFQFWFWLSLAYAVSWFLYSIALNLNYYTVSRKLTFVSSHPPQCLMDSRFYQPLSLSMVGHLPQRLVE